MIDSVPDPNILRLGFPRSKINNRAVKSNNSAELNTMTSHNAIVINHNDQNDNIIEINSAPPLIAEEGNNEENVDDRQLQTSFQIISDDNNNAISSYRLKIIKFESQQRLANKQNEQVKKEKSTDSIPEPIILPDGIVDETCGIKFPKISLCKAKYSLLLNILFPGVGTMIMACSEDENQKEYKDSNSFIILGIIQFILWILLVGWIWAIIVSMQLYHYTNFVISNKEKEKQRENNSVSQNNNILVTDP